MMHFGSGDRFARYSAPGSASFFFFFSFFLPFYSVLFCYVVGSYHSCVLASFVLRITGEIPGPQYGKTAASGPSFEYNNQLSSLAAQSTSNRLSSPSFTFDPRPMHSVMVTSDGILVFSLNPSVVVWSPF